MANFLSIFAGLAVTGLSSGATYFLNKSSVPELTVYPGNVIYFANFLIVPQLQQLTMIAVFYRKAKLRQAVANEMRSLWKYYLSTKSKLIDINMIELNL